MRLAVVADIHGNLHALEAVVADLDRQRVDRVVINGDMVNRGPNNTAVMTHLAGLGFPMTLGNHDDLMRSWVARDPSIPASLFEDQIGAGFGWCAVQLERGGWLDTFASLPMVYSLDLPGAPTLLISHGSPRHYREGYGSYLSDDTIAEIVRDWPADVLVGSHTHRPLERRWGDYLVLNTGAVGAPFNGDPRAQYLILTLEGDDWQPEFRRLDYDRAGALEAFHHSGFLAEGGLSARIFYEELRHARSFLTPFLMWTDEHALPQSWASWERFKAHFAERFRPLRSKGAC